MNKNTNSTKEKILNAALKLFNQDGIVNVRLQHIADEAFVSVGNLAYHFANKEAIVSALYEALTKKQKELLAEYRIVPLFDNFDRLIQHTFVLQNQYNFFYLDTLEIIRAYPSIGETHKTHITSQINQIKSVLEFNNARGATKGESTTGQFEKLARQVWMTMDLWMNQQAIIGGSLEDDQQYRFAVWNLLIPHFTEMGMREYQQMLEKPYDFYY